MNQSELTALEVVDGLLTPSGMSPAVRVLGAVAPALLLLASLAVAYPVFRFTKAGRSYTDAEVKDRKTGLSTPGLRVFFSWLMRPWFSLLVRAGFPPNAITTVSLGISLAAGVALAAGRFALGGWLFALAGACDFFDGRLARMQNTASPQGAALDSIVDRYSESAVLMGLAWYYRDTWVLLPALLALVGSLLVPYVRAKAEALSVPLQEVGWLQRPERVALLASTTALAPVLEVLIDPSNQRPLHWLTVLGLLVLGVGTQITAAQRTHTLVKLLAPAPPPSYSQVKPVSQLRVLSSSGLATASDMGLVALLVWAFSSSASLPIATLAGCLLGALVNFTLNRYWAFQATQSPIMGQARRYTIASLTSAVLNAGGVAVVALLPNVPSAIAWLLVRGTVFGVWTLPLYRTYVFEQVFGPLYEQQST